MSTGIFFSLKQIHIYVYKMCSGELAKTGLYIWNRPIQWYENINEYMQENVLTDYELTAQSMNWLRNTVLKLRVWTKITSYILFLDNHELWRNLSNQVAIWWSFHDIRKIDISQLGENDYSFIVILSNSDFCVSKLLYTPIKNMFLTFDDVQRRSFKISFGRT